MRAVDSKRSVFAIVVTVLLFAGVVFGQSTTQDRPTPVTTNEISGTIKPRDIGDARLTTYYYQFDGFQGDLFINIVTRNFTGDIDIFVQNGLRPLTKVVVYADFGENETGRVIYLRKPEKMLLRVQGRPPGDDVASFRIKFAGSFMASSLSEPVSEPELPSLAAKNESGIRVNSVGTIVEVIPKSTPTPPVTETAKVDGDDEPKDLTDQDKEKRETVAEKSPEKDPDPPVEVPTKKVEVVVTDNVRDRKEPAVPTLANRGRRNRRTGRPPAAKPDAETKEETKTNAEETPSTTDEAAKNPEPDRGRGRAKEPKPDPMANFNLVISMKDGSTIERPMTEVLRFTVDKGILTVIAKDGSIRRFSMVDVSKVTIE